MTYPQNMPLPMQQATATAKVVVGPTHCYARSPFWLSVGGVYPVDQIAEAEAEAEAMQALYVNCPTHQWGAAAMAGAA